MRFKILCLILVAVLANTGFCEVHLLKIDGIINPVVAEYISEGIKTASRGDTVIISMDTPGGLMDSMNKIIQSMLNSPNPVIVWVGPRGAKAGSAGVFITMAADVASMAPETNIGAAHPVQMGSIPQLKKQSDDKDKTMEQKITNDAVAYIRSITREKNRNWKWAEEAVTKSVSITSREALEKKVIDYVFSDIEELRDRLDGIEIEKLNQKFIIKTKGEPLIEKEMKPFKKFLNLIAHPNIAFILLMLGVYGLIYEFSSPGIGFGAAVGSICLIMAFFSLQLLPVNTAGLLFLILGIILMALDIFTPGFGILTTGGVISFIVGALMLFDVPSLRVSLSLIFSFALASVLFFTVAVNAIARVHRKKVTTGKEGLIGTKATAKSIFDKSNLTGTVFVHGELWDAELAGLDDAVGKNEKVEVVGLEGNKLKIKKINPV